MAAKKTKFVCGVRLTEERPGHWAWQLDNLAYCYDVNDGQLRNTVGGVHVVIATFERIELAVGFTLGAHEGAQLADRTKWMKVAKL